MATITVSGSWWELDSAGLLRIFYQGAMPAQEWGNQEWGSYLSDILSVVIESSTTSIGDKAFSSCFNLTSITIPNSVTAVGEYAFDDCWDLTDVYYNGTQAQWNQITIGFGNLLLTDAAIHYTPSAQTPTISTQPANASYATGDTAAPLTVFASVTDGGTLSYQWYTTGGAVSGATSDSYTPDTSTAGETGYYCTVTNTLGASNASVDSDTATVTVTDDNPLADIIYTGESKVIRRICRKLNEIGSGGGGTTYPRLIIDSGGYVAADYGPEEANENGNG